MIRRTERSFIPVRSAISACVRPWRRSVSTSISRGPHPAINCASRSPAWAVSLGDGSGEANSARDLAIAPADVQPLLPRHVVFLGPGQPAMLLVHLVPHHAAQEPAEMRDVLEFRGIQRPDP